MIIITIITNNKQLKKRLIMEMYENLKSLVESMEADVTKFYTSGNKAAGTRLRQLCQEGKKVLQDIRVDISDKKKV